MHKPIISNSMNMNNFLFLNKVITVQQNQELEIPNANIKIEPQELQGVRPVIVDNTEIGKYI